ncbi:hypothetical protein JX266_000677 [Neoarthrinium moseri]|uniref:uncharacterized protein n=1 Tax=Neoarthrinium moseri TaxID=1658444 RepID=UPI001FDAF287|nr:uncharacterized protein JN550_000016 [Neoarthrinium moseri]KAI1854559.1 hypothetical protein JX266_000677 [Neoarthrinium moseri]KAI1877834.1 hypothetical protein JN550_000016 [Neoarthrinium moseri]
MGFSKRKFSDFKTEPVEGGETEARDNDGFKRQKSKHVKKVKAKPDNLNWVKKRARTIERRFRTGQNLPADAKNDMERELVHHKQKIAEAEEEKKTKQMIKKYHMVRFFERKKADRLAKQIEKQIEQSKDPEEIKKLKDDLHIAQIDSLYAKFFPYRERYVSLYPVAATQGGEEAETASSAAKALKTDRPKLWATVEKLSKKGVPALIEFRDRKLGSDSRSKAPKERPSKHSFAAKAEALKAKSSLIAGPSTTKAGEGRMALKNPKNSKRAAESSDDNDSDSDGGFFEADDE